MQCVSDPVVVRALKPPSGTSRSFVSPNNVRETFRERFPFCLFVFANFRDRIAYSKEVLSWTPHMVRQSIVVDQRVRSN